MAINSSKIVTSNLVNTNIYGWPTLVMRVTIYILFFALILIATLLFLMKCRSSKREKKAIKLWNIPPNWSAFNHLIIVPGHSIQWCLEDGHEISDPTCWSLYEYQKKNINSFISHIEKGLEALALDEKAVLIFSGGQTRISAGPRSEAASYYQLARHLIRTNKIFNRRYDDNLISSILSRIVTEEYARDSLENLVFSICRFKSVTGIEPEKISVYGYASKEKRFRELHTKSINLDLRSFYYYGVSDSTFNFIDGAYELFSKDLTGCTIPELMKKRQERNPFNQSSDIYSNCIEFNRIKCSESNSYG